MAAMSPYRAAMPGSTAAVPIAQTRAFASLPSQLSTSRNNNPLRSFPWVPPQKRSALLVPAPPFLAPSSPIHRL